MNVGVMPDFIYTLGLLTENEKRSLSLSSLSLPSPLLSFTRDHDKSEGDVALPSNVFPPTENRSDRKHGVIAAQRN